MHITISTAFLFITAAASAYASENVIRLPFTRKGRSFETMAGQKIVHDQREPYQTPLYNLDRALYLIEVGVGTPEQIFNVALDTGSADLWIPSTDCPTNICPNTRFDPAQSSTFRPTNREFGIVYGTGSANGTYITDTVTIAGVSVQNQQLALVSTTSDILTNQPTVDGSETGAPSSEGPLLNGILGLAYPKLTATKADDTEYNPFVFNLAEQNLISQPIFSIYLNNRAADGWAGEIIFGGVDKSKFIGEMMFVPVAQKKSRSSGNQLDTLLEVSSYAYYYWMVYGQGIALVNSKKAGSNEISFNSPVSFIIDTGTTFTYLPSDVAHQVAEGLAGKGNYLLDQEKQVFRCDCNVRNSGASFQLQISSSSDVNSDAVWLTVPVSELVVPIDSLSLQEAKYCMLGIAPSGESEPDMYLIGESVLRSAYMVFDMGENRIGFATAQNVPGSVKKGSRDRPIALDGISDLQL